MAEDPVLRVESGTLDDVEPAALTAVLCLVGRPRPDDARPPATTRWPHPERAAVFVPPHSRRSDG
ncbi:acyl-CoA carboxylase subunit epsilon [Actinosynnema sp. NPDC047251]|uniref:acyl-CoA carboxylase subunit epsilon n=1 Tax=Saccharothrix espanaensis TaxID=103731 RepID=UPI0002FAD4A0|nr:acyl-CoA carboxylase subunit epsilon [Saccharothrix espanaensis]